MVGAYGFAEGKHILFGVNRFPGGVAVKGGNVIYVLQLKIIL